MKDSLRRRIERLVAENVHSLRADGAREELYAIAEEIRADAIRQALPESEPKPQEEQHPNGQG